MPVILPICICIILIGTHCSECILTYSTVIEHVAMYMCIFSTLWWPYVHYSYIPYYRVRNVNSLYWKSNEFLLQPDGRIVTSCDNHSQFFLLTLFQIKMVSSCTVKSIFLVQHAKNKISDSKNISVYLEHAVLIPKYPSKVKQTWHGFNYYHTKHHWIPKLCAIWLN